MPPIDTLYIASQRTCFKGIIPFKKDPSISLGGLSLKDLRANHPSVAQIFETETLDIMSVFTSDESDIHELFVRLNRSKPLTGAELRNAMLGPVPDVIRFVAKHAFFEENIRFIVKRAADQNAAAKLVLFEYYEKPMGTKKRDMDDLVNDDSVEKRGVELSGRRAIENLEIMTEIFLPKDELLSSAGQIPVYY